MIFNGDLLNGKKNIEEWLHPLFDAIIQGGTITQIICMRGTMNKDNRQLDFVLEIFCASEYWQGIAFRDNQEIDYVQGEPREFYMNWVISFIL